MPFKAVPTPSPPSSGRVGGWWGFCGVGVVFCGVEVVYCKVEVVYCKVEVVYCGLGGFLWVVGGGEWGFCLWWSFFMVMGAVLWVIVERFSW